MNPYANILIVYSAWKSLRLAQSLLHQCDLYTDVSEQLNMCERELRANMDILPSGIADEIKAYFNQLTTDWQARYRQDD